MESHLETYGCMSQTIKPQFKKQYIREDKNEKELVSVFTATTDEVVLPSPDDKEKEYEAIFLKSTNWRDKNALEFAASLIIPHKTYAIRRYKNIILLT